MYSLDVHPDGTRLATGGIGECLHILTPVALHLVSFGRDGPNGCMNTATSVKRVEAGAGFD